jgi:hypothetical protein
MARLFDDTAPEAEAVLVELARAATPAAKLQMVDQLNARITRLLCAGLRQRFASADEGEIRRRLADLLLGEALAAQVYEPLPPDWEPTRRGEHRG